MADHRLLDLLCKVFLCIIHFIIDKKIRIKTLNNHLTNLRQTLIYIDQIKKDFQNPIQDSRQNEITTSLKIYDLAVTDPKSSHLGSVYLIIIN